MENTPSKMENAQSKMDPDTVSRSKRAKIDTKYNGNANVFLRIVLTPKLLGLEVSAYSEFIFMVKEGIYLALDAVDYCW